MRSIATTKNSHPILARTHHIRCNRSTSRWAAHGGCKFGAAEAAPTARQGAPRKAAMSAGGRRQAQRRDEGLRPMAASAVEDSRRLIASSSLLGAGELVFHAKGWPRAP